LFESSFIMNSTRCTVPWTVPCTVPCTVSYTVSYTDFDLEYLNSLIEKHIKSGKPGSFKLIITDIPPGKTFIELLEDEVFKELLKLKREKQITIKARSDSFRHADEPVKFDKGKILPTHKMFNELDKKGIESINISCVMDTDDRLVYNVSVTHPKKVIHSETDCSDDPMEPSLKCDIIRSSSRFFIFKLLIVVAIILIVLFIWNSCWNSCWDSFWDSFWDFFINDQAQDDPNQNTENSRFST